VRRISTVTDSHMYRDATLSNIKKIAVIGFGTMGQGIAQTFIQSAYDVKIFDLRTDQIQPGLKAIKMRLKTLVRHNILSEHDASMATRRIEIASTIEDAVRGTQFVEEAVPENLALKKKIFKKLDQLCEREVILASNSSSFRISEIASRIKRGERCVGTHWFNPAYIVPLVEVVRGSDTSDMTVNVTKCLLAKLGKSPIVCKDSPGFVANRIQHVMNNEAMLILQEGLASADDIDTAVKMSFGLRLPVMGPLQTLDSSGLDVALGIRKYLHRKLHSARFKPPKVLLEKVRLGQLGLKSGKGFYNYEKSQTEKIIRKRDEKLMELFQTVAQLE